MANLDWARVMMFVEVMQRGSFTAAARRLGLPISSVSRGVARLEDELGVRLLHRTTRKLAPTEGGAAYFQRMQAAVSEAHAATEAVKGQAESIEGRVVLTAPPGLVPLPRLLAEILRGHPGLQIELITTMRTLDLIEEGIDLAIRGGTLADSSLVAHRIARTDFGIVASPSYLAERGTPRKLKDLSQHDCIRLRTRSGVTPWLLEGPGTSRPSKTPIALGGGLICDDLSYLHQAALAGAGLALLPVPVLAEELHAGRLVRVLSRYSAPAGALQVVWPSHRLLPARVALVRDLLVKGLKASISRSEVT